MSNSEPVAETAKPPQTAKQYGPCLLRARNVQGCDTGLEVERRNGVRIQTKHISILFSLTLHAGEPVQSKAQRSHPSTHRSGLRTPTPGLRTGKDSCPKSLSFVVWCTASK